MPNSAGAPRLFLSGFTAPLHVQAPGAGGDEQHADEQAERERAAALGERPDDDRDADHQHRADSTCVEAALMRRSTLSAA